MKNIDDLLQEHKLLHFQYFKDPDRIIYTKNSGTSSHIADFQKLIELLKENNIKHNDIGIDVIMIEES